MNFKDVVDELLAAYGELRRFLARRLGNADDAADLAQSSLERVYAHALAAPVESPRALLFHTARNLCADHARHQAVTRAWAAERSALDDEAGAPSAEHVAAHNQIAERVAERLLDVPARRREVFLLHRGYGCSRKEIATQLGITEAAVAKHLLRATQDCDHALGDLAPAPRRPRARSKAALAAFALVAGAAWLFGWQLRQPTFEQAFATGTAQLARAALPDGSSLELSAKTALRATLYRDRRLIELDGGEARFDVAADRERPFIVRTPLGTIEVVGTAFIVAYRGDDLRIEVERGRVRVRPGEAGEGIELERGEGLSVRPQGSGAIERLAGREIAAWREGWLVFDNQPLEQALPAINAFRERPLRLADAEVGKLRITGRFRATDSAGLVGALPHVLPVEARQAADGSVELRHR